MKKVLRMKSSDPQSWGKSMGEFFKVMKENDLVEIVYRYRRKQPVLLKKGTRTRHRVYASSDHPESKKIHELIVRIISEKRRSIFPLVRRRIQDYHVQHPPRKKVK